MWGCSGQLYGAVLPERTDVTPRGVGKQQKEGLLVLSSLSLASWQVPLHHFWGFLWVKELVGSKHGGW